MNVPLTFAVDYYSFSDEERLQKLEEFAAAGGRHIVLTPAMLAKMAASPGYKRELEKELADCYRNTLDFCAENRIKTLAFCCISTGVFHFPNKRAAEIAVQTVTAWLAEHPDQMERVIFNVFKDEDKEYYEAELF